MGLVFLSFMHGHLIITDYRFLSFLAYFLLYHVLLDRVERR